MTGTRQTGISFQPKQLLSWTDRWVNLTLFLQCKDRFFKWISFQILVWTWLPFGAHWICRAPLWSPRPLGGNGSNLQTWVRDHWKLVLAKLNELKQISWSKGLALQPISLHFSVTRCGYPGLLANGQMIGRSYLFGDVVHYSCDRGKLTNDCLLLSNNFLSYKRILLFLWKLDWFWARFKFNWQKKYQNLQNSETVAEYI